ncbi:MAG: rhodanese-like domain-containing protein [Acidobacteriota bacterium]
MTRKTGGLEVPAFDPDLHRAPTEVFRRFAAGAPPRVIELVSRTGEPAGTTLVSAQPVSTEELAAGDAPLIPWQSDELLLIDESGEDAEAWARRLRARGFQQVYALYGGLGLYRFALDPAVVGEERYLRPRRPDRPGAANRD